MSELKNKKSLVIYFSRADENYAVGYIDKGNTEYIAEYVRDIVGADLFKVEPLIPYSKEYNKCIEVSNLIDKLYKSNSIIEEYKKAKEKYK